MIALGWISLIVWSSALTAFDVRSRRLPNVLTLGGFLAVVTVGATLGIGQRTIVGSICLALPYLFLHLLSPKSLGAGDVKLALGLGGVASFGGAASWTMAALGGPVLSAIVGALWVARGRGRTASIPHGASMCVATFTGLAVA